MLVSIVTARAIAAELKSRRIDPTPVLAQAGIRQEALNDSRELVSVASLGLLVQQSLRLSQDPALGLHVGLHTPLLTTQILGPLLLSCVTLREAIGALRKFAPLLVTGVTWSLAEGKTLSSLRVDLGVKDSEFVRFFYEYVTVLMFRFGATFCGRELDQDVEVAFRHDAPGYVAVYDTIFHHRVRFGADANRISFPTALLDRPQPHSDTTLYALFTDTAELLLRERQGKSIADKVRMTLRFGSTLASADVKSIAQAVGISPRALRRKLKSEGATATALLEEERMRVASERLRDPARSIKEIAENLGFSEPSAFHRAFKRWTGLTPSKYAKQAQRSEHGALVPGSVGEERKR